MSKQRILVRVAFVAVVIGLCLAANGCTGKAPKQTEFMKTVGGVGMTAEALRYLVRDGAEPYAGIIEDSADRIMAQTDDPEVRTAALMWKARAIPRSRRRRRSAPTAANEPIASGDAGGARGSCVET